MATNPARSRQTLETYIRAWGTNDRALLLSLFTEDAILEDPVGTPAFKGHEGIGGFWDFAHLESDRTLTPVLEEIRACGDQAIMRFVMQVRAPAQQAGLDLSIIEHIAFAEDGRIRRIRAFWDETSLSKPEGMVLLLPDIEQAYKN